MTDSSIQLRDCSGATEFPRLTEIWRSAVRATHDFLSPADVVFYEKKTASEYLPALHLRVAEIGGIAVGFAGTSANNLEMLFIDDDYRGRGIGTTLLNDALTRLPHLTVDVNEQNPAAVEFYRRRGFAVVGRSETDADGRPYPLLHMAHGVADHSR